MITHRTYLAVLMTILLAVLIGCGSSNSGSRSAGPITTDDTSSAATDDTSSAATDDTISAATDDTSSAATDDTTLTTPPVSTPDWDAIEADRALCQSKALADYPITGALDYAEISRRMQQQNLSLTQCLNTVAIKYGIKYGQTGDEVSDLYEACSKGDMESCDSLYASAPEGSEERRFAGTCGDTMILGPRDTCVGRQLLDG